jgi:hypothetical protein
MASAGYSGTPLVKKLGINPATKLILVNAPDNYNQLLETNIDNQLCRKKETPDLVHLFVTNRKEFETEMKRLQSLIQRNKEIVIWVSWYKKSAKIDTDITEDTIREYALRHELVDIKVCAVSDIWSGLKLVVPKNKRG